MKANELPLTTFLEKPKVQYIIPVYQRNYDWTITECKRLLDDIIAVETNNISSHFIGSIVFVHDGIFGANNVDELVIIDGQQRLTTISILYVSLYRFALAHNLQQEAEMIFNMYLTNQYVTHKSKRLKLKQNNLNAEAFSSILNNTEKSFSQYSNVIENFHFFSEQITESNFNTILNGIGRLLFVEISLERGKDNPQRIFESLNSTGLDLTQSDLIRNFILMDLEASEQDRIYEQIWHPIEENAKDHTKQKSMVSEYIRDYLTLRNKKIPNKSKVYFEFKSLYPDKKDEAYQQELEMIKALSYQYKKLLNPDIEEDQKLRRELKHIDQLEVNVAFPFLIQVFEDADNGIITTTELLKILKLIQTYTWRRFIVGLPTNALNKIFMTLYSEVEVDDYYNSIAIALLKKRGSGKFPNNDEVITALKDRDLYNIKAKNRNYMFEMLENFNNNEIVDVTNERITIEHIFPQTPTDDWKNQLTPDDYILFKEKYLNTIANLTLSGNNEALSNKTFAAKKTMNVDNGEQGYEHSRLWLNKFISQIESWNMENYSKRFEIISSRFLNIWQYPDVEIPEDEVTTEVNIFDAEKPTFKKLEYFIFENTKVEEAVIAQMYFYVIRKLFKRNAELLLSQGESFKCSKNQVEFRAPQEVVNGYYAEANIDSNTKFNILKKLLSAFSMEDELIIKYEDQELSSGSNRHKTRKKFWGQLLSQITGTELFKNINPSKEGWLGTGAGISGVGFYIAISKSYIRIELALSSSEKEKNKKFFYHIYKNKDIIEKAFGHPLTWEELPNNKMSRIKYELKEANMFNDEDWPAMTKFVVENLPDFEKALRPYIAELKWITNNTVSI